ncbi:thioredoxin domain-containing protein 11 [Neosynchiropus ocellatus]
MLRRVRRSLRQVLSLMARRPDLLCGAILLGVLLVLAVKFTCSRAKNVVAVARPPTRFFSADAPVIDLYLGQLDQVDRLRSVAEVSLVFFYAPWCAHSMAARQELQQVAGKLAKQVQFVAINCWWNHGKCRKQNHFYQFPTVHLFYRRFGPIEYRGPILASYVESFVLRVVTPLTYLPSRARLEEFLSCHEPRVVGFFQFNSSPQPPGYLTYLSSALQALKRDFRGVVRFGVVTSQRVAAALSIHQDETVYLHRRLNSSLIFPRRERNFTSESICSWVFEHRESVLQWLQPPGTKSRLLEHELTKGPALLLFLPHDPTSEPDPVLQQVADVALRYHSCDRDHHSNWDGSFSSDARCCQSLSVPRPGAAAGCWLDVCRRFSRRDDSCGVFWRDVLQTHLTHCCLRPPPADATPLTSVSCFNFANGYGPSSRFSACCWRSMPPLQNQTLAKDARQAPQRHDHLTGLRCHTNRTLRFYVLDVALNRPLALSLGADDASSSSPGGTEGPEGDGPFAAIVNLKDESHYVLPRSPAATLTQSLEAFIRNFSAPHSVLQRHLVGQEVKSGRAHESRPSTRPLIAELTTATFLPSVMDAEKDVLLFYYTQWCGFCSVLNHVLIQLARLLQRNGSIAVARVNVARNDLPWEFMVDHVPSLLFFPRHRKHHSVKFPDDLAITLPNLLHFILRHAGSPHRSDARGPGGSGADTGLHAEFLALQREVETLHHARELLSRQLTQLWRENRKLTFDTRELEARNSQLQRERQQLEEQHREKSRQLVEAVRRLQELADASENLLRENMLLRMLLRALKDRTGAEEEPAEEDVSDGQSRNNMTS